MEPNQPGNEAQLPEAAQAPDGATTAAAVRPKRWSRLGRVRWAKLGLRLAVASWVLLLAVGFYALGDPPPGPEQAQRLLAKTEVVKLFLLLVGFCQAGSALSATVGLFSPSWKRATIALVLALTSAAFLLVPIWTR